MAIEKFLTGKTTEINLKAHAIDFNMPEDTQLNRIGNSRILKRLKD